jgi:hypothetical protein
MAAVVEQILGEGWNVNTSDAVTSNDPEKIYKEWDYLRSNCPVAKVDRHCPDGYWLMTRYEDIKNCASDSGNFSDTSSLKFRGTNESIDTFISRVHAVVPSGKSIRDKARSITNRLWQIQEESVGLL